MFAAAALQALGFKQYDYKEFPENAPEVVIIDMLLLINSRHVLANPASSMSANSVRVRLQYAAALRRRGVANRTAPDFIWGSLHPEFACNLRTRPAIPFATLRRHRRKTGSFLHWLLENTGQLDQEFYFGS